MQSMVVALYRSLSMRWRYSFMGTAAQIACSMIVMGATYWADRSGRLVVVLGALHIDVPSQSASAVCKLLDIEYGDSPAVLSHDCLSDSLSQLLVRDFEYFGFPQR